MMKRLRLNKEEKEGLGLVCYVDVTAAHVFVYGGAATEAAFPIRHWEEVKKYVDKQINEVSK